MWLIDVWRVKVDSVDGVLGTLGRLLALLRNPYGQPELLTREARVLAADIIEKTVQQGPAAHLYTVRDTHRHTVERFAAVAYTTREGEEITEKVPLFVLQGVDIYTN